MIKQAGAEITSLLKQQQSVIEDWFKQQWTITPPTFYCSIDLRHAGFKLAPVDTNLFPAGFNNLAENCQPKIVDAMTKTLRTHGQSIQRILIIPESHTRNIMYWENIAKLVNLLTKAGFTVQVGSLLPELTQAKNIKLPSGAELTLAPITKKNQQIYCGDFLADIILSNNDFAEGAPDILQDISQPMIPPVSLGWSKRLKSMHFQHYHHVSVEFAKLLNVDPWQFEPLFQFCGDIDFMSNKGEDCLIKYSQTLLNAIKQKYAEYNVKQKPFIVIKADAGTYGMAVMKINDPEEIHQLNRKQRIKMAKGKGGVSVTKAIVQEGVYSIEKYNNSVAEPVIYLIGQESVGGFYRVHPDKQDDENLNMPGMEFYALPCVLEKHYEYRVVARLAALAAARELAEVNRQ